jgi:hypothetical protein
MFDLLAYPLYTLGAVLCAMNFYLSFLRAPLLIRKGVPRDEIRHVSGAPLLGTVFVLVGLPAVQHVPGLVPLGILLILIDTGGPHWFVGTMLFMAVGGRRPHA